MKSKRLKSHDIMIFANLSIKIYYHYVHRSVWRDCCFNFIAGLPLLPFYYRLVFEIRQKSSVEIVFVCVRVHGNGDTWLTWWSVSNARYVCSWPHAWTIIEPFNVSGNSYGCFRISVSRGHQNPHLRITQYAWKSIASACKIICMIVTKNEEKTGLRKVTKWW